MSRCVFPVPELPKSTSGSPASIHAPVAGMRQGRRRQVRDLGQVQVFEAFAARELRFLDLPGPVPVIAFLAFVGQGLGEVSEAAPLLEEQGAVPCPTRGANRGQNLRKCSRPCVSRTDLNIPLRRVA